MGIQGVATTETAPNPTSNPNPNPPSNPSDPCCQVRGLKTELHETVQHIQDPKALKDSVKRMYQKHVTEAVASRAIEPDIAAEYTRQREYLEKSVESLKRKLNKNMELHRSDNMRMMQVRSCALLHCTTAPLLPPLGPSVPTLRSSPSSPLSPHLLSPPLTSSSAPRPARRRT